jgi:hypothetical protein
MRPERFGRSGSLELAEIVGCVFGDTHSYVLGEPPPRAGTPSGTGGIRLETLAGSMVAYEEGSGGPTGASWVVTVRDLRSGKVVHSVPTGTSSAAHIENGLVRQNEGIGPAKTIVVKGDGAVAWIAQAPGEGSYQYQVHALDKTGSRLLASGVDVDPSSLALGGSTLYWTQEGKPMSSVLN